MCIVCVKTIHRLYTNYAWSLPQPLPKGKGFVAALMHHHGLKETKSQRDEETKSGCLPQPLPKGKGFVAALMHRTWGSFWESKRLRVKKWEGGRERKTMGRLRKTMGRLRKTRGRLGKTRGRLRKTRGRLGKTRGRLRKTRSAPS